MPLPVERSQGSVSSLVARFQNAADRDAEQARRQSLPSRRVSSNTFPRAVDSPSPSGATPSPQKAQIPLEANGTVSDEDKARSPAKATGPDDQAGDNEANAVGKIKEKSRDLVEGIKQMVVGEHHEDGPAKDQATKDPMKPVQLTTPKKETLGRLTKSPHEKVSSAKSTPSKTPSARVQSVPSPKASSASSSKSSQSPIGKSISQPSATPTKSPRATAPSIAKQPSPAQIASSTKPVPKTNPSSTVRPTPATRTPRLVPSATGPARHAASNGASPAHNDLQPLKAQLTGTPSRPTASYLAKTRSPGTVTAQAENRAHTSTTRSTSGSAPGRSRLSMSPGASPPAAPRATAASGSRLLQGTAASRAKAAEAKAPGASVNSKTTQPAASGDIKSASTRRTTVKGVAANGRAESKGPAVVKPPAGARLGLAAAGVGQGGKTGKELNDDLSARLKSGEITGEEIVRRGEEGTLGELTMGTNEEEGASSSHAREPESTREDVAVGEAAGNDEAPAPVASIGDTEVQQATAGKAAGEEESFDEVEASSAPPVVSGQTDEGGSGSAPDSGALGDGAAGQRDMEEIPDV